MVAARSPGALLSVSAVEPAAPRPQLIGVTVGWVPRLETGRPDGWVAAGGGGYGANGESSALSPL